jgi:hypothetical protein
MPFLGPTSVLKLPVVENARGEQGGAPLAPWSQRFARMNRRMFLFGAGGVLGVTLLDACSLGGRSGEGPATSSTPEGAPDARTEPSDLSASLLALQGPAMVRATEDAHVSVTWKAAPGVVYDGEHVGRMQLSLENDHYEFGAGPGLSGLVEGPNVIRVLGRRAGSSTWSEPLTINVRPVGRLRTRGFDFEPDGQLDVTFADPGTVFAVGAEHGRLGGKGVRLAADGTSPGRAYKRLMQLPTDDCWLRFAVRPTAGTASVVLARIGSADFNLAERLTWRQDRGISSATVSDAAPAPLGQWTEVQLGVRLDGTVELWTFDGQRETLVGRAVNPRLTGRRKDIVSFGNSLEADGPYEVWFDDVCIGSAKQPWASNRRGQLVRPTMLDPGRLPATFTFVFGSCINANHVPLDGTALAAAAAASPDFFLNLGDYGYPDTSAWSQTTAGYIAHWADLTQADHVDDIATKPWIMMASDHDMGGNNTTSATLQPFAARAFAAWQNNDPTVDGVGRYGAVSFDGGRVLLLWTEGVLFRSPLGEDGTFLGDAQKRWLLSQLSSTEAGLVIIALQTTIGHNSDTGVSANPTERAEILAAAARCRGQVRFITGDYHAARWAKFGPKVAEWGAAPLAEFPQPVPDPMPDVVDHGTWSVGRFPSRPAALATLTLAEFNAATTFGRVRIDTERHEATFELLDPKGAVRQDQLGRPMNETLRY